MKEMKQLYLRPMLYDWEKIYACLDQKTICEVCIGGIGGRGLSFCIAYEEVQSKVDEC